MFRTTVAAAALALLSISAASFAADVPAPVTARAPAKFAPANTIRQSDYIHSPREDSRLEPTAEDMEKARRAAEQRRRGSDRVTQYRSPKGTIGGRTTIEEYHDQNNRVTEVKVTSGITEIPYTMENRSNRPVDTNPGQNPQSTLGTPKFIKFGW